MKTTELAYYVKKGQIFFYLFTSQLLESSKLIWCRSQWICSVFETACYTQNSGTGCHGWLL